MVLLLVVMAIVLVLAAQAWRSVAPAALEASDAGRSGPLDDHGQPDAAAAVRRGELPRLPEARQLTDEHGARVQEALNGTE